MDAARQDRVGSGWRAFGLSAVVVFAGVALSGCISVNAPDKPIVIELNINIKQEVIYKLAADAVDTIEANPDIF
jgi:anti-sigma-K factor RskA